MCWAGITNVSSVIGYDKTADGTIVPIPGRLVYRGIDIDTLAAEADNHDRFLFEEVVWLLLFGSLPNQEQHAKFCKLLEHHRELPRGFADDMILNSPSPNLMNKMARSVLAMYSYDEHAEDSSLPNILRQSINLIAELPTMMVNAYQIKRRVYDRSSMYFHLPTEGQSTAEHILSTYRRTRNLPTRKPVCWTSACWSMPTTAAATAPPSPAGFCPAPAPTPTRPSRRPSAP